jgi:glycosyltransferase involved in cell wall biosynthesis
VPAASICALIVVRNEEQLLPRAVTSALHVAEQVVVVDTGSTDRTVTVATGLVGASNVHRLRWQGSGRTRTRALKLARYYESSYILCIDADHTLELAGPVPELTADAYLTTERLGDTRYLLPRLVRADLDWRFVGATHDHLDTHGRVLEPAPWLICHNHDDPGRQPRKFERDLRILTRQYRRDPGDARTVFYLAQTLAALERYEEAADMYARRVAIDDVFPEERWYAAFMHGASLYNAGRVRQAILALLYALEMRPQRAEAANALAIICRNEGLETLARLFAGARPDRPPPRDILFVDLGAYPGAYPSPPNGDPGPAVASASVTAPGQVVV